MSENKIKIKEAELKEIKINNSNGNFIRDSRPKLDTSAVNHGGTISNSSVKKEKNKNQK